MSNDEEIKQKITFRRTAHAIKISTALYFRAGKFDMVFTSAIRIVLSVVPAVTAILSGLAVNELINAATETHDPWPVLRIIMLILSVVLARSLLQQFCTYRETRSGYNVRLYMNRQLFEKYARLSLTTRHTKEFADLFERVNQYGYQVDWVFKQMQLLVSSAVAFASAFVAMFLTLPILATIVTLAVVPLAIVNFIQNGKERKRWEGRTTDRRRRFMIQRALTDTSYALELKMNDLVPYFIDEAIRIERMGRDDEMKYERQFYGIRSALNALDYLVEYGSLSYVVWQIILGAIPVGQFVTIQSLLGNLNESTQSFLGWFSAIGRDLMSANDFAKFMDLPENINGSIGINPSTPPSIEFRNVSIQYPNNDTPVLDGISFKIKPGEDIAIVGENGAGKTTLVKLLIGAYQPTSGAILVNGTPLQDLDQKSWQRQLSALFQDYLRYDFATLGDNIWYGDITQKQDKSLFDRALAKADLNDFAGKFAKGYNQYLNKDLDKDLSADLSGGQWQRLALARSFFRNANILILDEPTASVDAKAEYQVFKEIIEQQKTKTTIIISHRFSTVRKAERIVVLDKGRIVEDGSHAELMAQKDGLYREMFELQAEGYL